MLRSFCTERVHRGATARTVIVVLAAVLAALQLQLLSPTASFASTHTTRQAVVEVHPGTKATGKAMRSGVVTCNEIEQLGSPSSLSRTRSRHRVSCAPAELSLALPAHPGSAASEPATAACVPDRTSRPPRAHTPALLQVFRC
jgi:hypothetical protein